MRRGGLVLGAALTIVALAASYVAYAAVSSGLFEAGAAGDQGIGETTGERAEDGREETAPEKTRDVPLSKSANFDPRDERQVVGGSDDVFFGRVLGQTGSEKAPPVGSRGFREPQTQYAVEVTQAIKGELSGTTITLNQRGGSPNAPDAPGGGSYLEEGREYLFLTKYVESKGWHQVVLPGIAGVVEVEDRAQREKIEQGYEEAYANQIEVNLPLGPATPEEAEERSYRPCWLEGSTPPGWERPCDPSDPLPAAKEEGFMDKVKSSAPAAPAQEKTRNEALAEVREQGASSEQRPGDRVFYEGDIQYNCDEAFRVLDRYQAVKPTTPGYDDFEFQFGFAEAEENVRRCIDEYGVLPRDGEDPIEDAKASPRPKPKPCVRRRDGQAGTRSSYRIVAASPQMWSRSWGWALVP